VVNTNAMRLYSDSELQIQIQNHLGSRKRQHLESPDIESRTNSKSVSVMRLRRHQSLKQSDLVIIKVPEEMEIHGIVCPSLHGKVAKIISIHDEEVEAELVDAVNSNGISGQVEIPIFCLYQFPS
jgi:hypothetical protein